jgi:uncharacterized protein (DUF2267 family)
MQARDVMTTNNDVSSFRVLTNYITAGETEDIRQALPRELNAFWLADAWLAR